MNEQELPCIECKEPVCHHMASDCYVCFRCMKQWNTYNWLFIGRIKRIGPGDWRFGNHQQTMVNQVWSEEAELLFEPWFAKEILR